MSKPMSLTKKIALTTLAVLLILAGTGHVTATRAQTAIEQDIRNHVLAKGISGIRFGGEKVPPEKIEVTSRVEWPFVVVGSYSVPWDLHASHHQTTYLVLPWGRYILSTESMATV